VNLTSQQEAACHVFLRTLAATWKQRLPDLEFSDLYQEAALGMVTVLARPQAARKFIARRCEGAIQDLIRRDVERPYRIAQSWEIHARYGQDRIHESAEAHALAQETARIIAATVAALPEQERRVIVGHYYEGVTFLELSKRLRRSSVSIVNYHKRALKKLRKATGEEIRGL